MPAGRPRATAVPVVRARQHDPRRIGPDPDISPQQLTRSTLPPRANSTTTPIPVIRRPDGSGTGVPTNWKAKSREMVGVHAVTSLSRNAVRPLVLLWPHNHCDPRCAGVRGSD